MEPFKSILVDVDATAASQPALERALLLSQQSGAALTIVDVMTVPPLTRRYLSPALEETMANERRLQLSRLAGAAAANRPQTKLLFGRPATVLIQEIQRSGHDLLMRSHARDVAASGPKGFGAVDFELLRKCPSPILLVRHGSPSPHPNIMAAVNASTDDSAEQRLNTHIVEMTLLMSRYLNARSTTVLQAWTPFAERTIRSHVHDDALAAYVESARKNAADDLRDFLQSFKGRVTGIQSALRRGEPDDVIPQYVVAEGIDLVVMGTVARAGIAGILIGNTAERILRKLPCSVLAVKPAGFVSSVRPDGS